MEVLSLELPAMYGDHHVIEVRRLLLETPGIEDVYASSGFHVTEITYDPEKVSVEDIKEILDKSGYIGELPIPKESGIAVNQGNKQDTYYRHTEAYERTKNVVSFAQQVDSERRALWPCPGMNPIISMDDE